MVFSIYNAKTMVAVRLVYKKLGGQSLVWVFFLNEMKTTGTGKKVQDKNI